MQKLFVVPSFTPFQATIPFGRVNHNKYMVTDSVAYIGENHIFSFHAHLHTILMIATTAATATIFDQISFCITQKNLSPPLVFSRLRVDLRVGFFQPTLLLCFYDYASTDVG